MGFINKAFDVIGEAAFGDISKMVTAKWEQIGDIYNFMTTPIGLLYKSHDFMFEQLKRNIGTVNGLYDGYGTPIGEVSNPFYNSIVMTPWFMLDESKQMTSNYIEYVKKTYGASLSVENINIPIALRLDDRATRVATTSLSNIIGKIPALINLNENGTDNDTRLGKVSANYVYQTMDSAIAYNDLKFGKIKGVAADGTKIVSQSTSKGITDALYYYFGLKSDSFANALRSFSSAKSIEGKNTLSDNFKLAGPVYDNSNYGTVRDMGIYLDFYKSLNDITKGFYKNNVVESGNKYYPSDKPSDNHAYVDNGPSYSKKVNSVSDIFGNVMMYSEGVDIIDEPSNMGTRFNKYSTFDSNLPIDDLVRKTNDIFLDGRRKTILGKFYTGNDDNADYKTDIIQTAVSKKYGMSHGRNLLKKNTSDANGYDNPYCRVWTYHHQYSTLKDLIRPFAEADGNNNFRLVSQSELATNYGFDQFEAFHNLKGFPNGRSRLEEHGVLNKRNGLVNISPIEDGIADNKVDIKNCMFSIENLAWKDTLTGISSYNVETISDEQKGPFGGRIMWFPPYDLKFNEDVNVSWAETSFIGRGESIYTYKNTKRTGTISFKLLIDHPSILNYWTNAGNNTDEVDDNNVPGNEQELLRFFAGCDFLTPRVEKSKKKETATKDEPISTPNTETYTFFVFFPNNYSGVDDDANYAMDYLINGYGTWMVEGQNGAENYKKTSDIVEATYKEGTRVGGYEVRPGISLDYPIKKDDYGASEIGITKYGNGKELTFVPIKGNGQDFKYYYRVDSKYASTPLKGGNANYMDLALESTTFNSKHGLDDVRNFAGGKKENVFSFADFYVAMQADAAMYTLSGLYNQENYNLIRSRIKDRKKYITNVSCTGSASKPGGDNKNLAQNRANKVKEWLASGGINLCSKDKIKVKKSGEFGGDDDINSKLSKLYRHVRVDIELSTEEENATQNLAKDGYNNFEPGQVNAEKKVVRGDETVLDKKNTSIEDMTGNFNYDKTLTNLGKEIFNTIGNYHHWNYVNTRQPNVEGEKASDLPGQNNYPDGNPKKENYKEVNDNQSHLKSNETRALNNGEMESQGGYNTNSTGNEAVGNKRYEGEAQFFELLELKNPFLHHKIREKVKYFDPAFHSISPEGFNARLTFLQQCCRQGPTNGATDSGAENTATNLAFGRPPVCILRIGDFFYTKIIIEGVTIDYNSNGLQWDLNPEGIGVMPMMADVTIRFNFIGGSSLAGPISRLQNALSFNMYANTEVYDDRAELAEYNPDTGEITKLAPFNPSV